MNQKTVIRNVLIVALVIFAGYLFFSKMSVQSNTINWVVFNSVKDTGIKPDFTFKHPSDWMQKGSVDAGAISRIPFYQKDDLSPVATVLVGDSSVIPVDGINQSQTSEEIIVDGYQGTKRAGFPQIDEKEMRVIVPQANGMRFEFSMSIRSTADEEIFNEILKTISFR